MVNSETTQLLNASVLIIIAMALYLGPIVAAYYFVLWARRRDWTVRRVFVSLFALWLASFPGLLSMPANYLSPFLPWFAIFMSGIAAVRRDEGELHPLFVPVFQVVLAGVLFVALFLASTTMWLPAERIDVAGTPKQVYVLNDSGEDLLVFDLKARIVTRISGKDVSNRQFCYQEDFKTFAQMILGKPRGLPECPRGLGLAVGDRGGASRCVRPNSAHDPDVLRRLTRQVQAKDVKALRKRWKAQVARVE